MQKKKILYLITKATWGGAQRYAFDLATKLPRDKFEPVVAYGQGGKLACELAAAKIETRELPSLARDIAAWSDIKSFFEIWRCIRAERPDAVHLNSSKAAALGALAARACGARRIVFTVHGWPFGEKRNIISRSLIWLVSWFTALLSHRIICVSDYDLAIAQRMPFVAKKAARVYNGIDLSMQFGSGERIRSAFPAGATITGTIGELTYNKNQLALLEEAKRTPAMHVAIVGEGELRPLLEQKIREYGLQDRVKLFGFLSASEVLKGFDVFALPSIKEGLPYTLLEAKLAGLPIEANRVGGVREILDRPLEQFSLEHMVRETAALY